MSPGKMSVSQAQDVGFLRIFVDMFVDTHTHFYDEWLLPDAEAAIQRALDAGVGKMIQADVDSHERPAMWEVGRRHPGVLFQMLGLYPGSVAADWREELDQVFSLSGERDCVAIGEIGLDYHEGLEFVQQQKEVLRQQLELAASLDLPVNIHLRDAWEDFLAILADCKHLNLRGGQQIWGFLRGHRRGGHLQERLHRQNPGAHPPGEDPPGDRRPLPRSRSLPGKTKRKRLPSLCSRQSGRNQREKPTGNRKHNDR